MSQTYNVIQYKTCLGASLSDRMGLFLGSVFGRGTILRGILLKPTKQIPAMVKAHCASFSSLDGLNKCNIL